MKRKEEKGSPNGLLFLFSMKILILKADLSIPKNELKDLHATIVSQMRTTGTVLLPKYISVCDYKDVECFGEQITYQVNGGGVRLFGQ